MKDRLKEVRKMAHVSQEAFAQSLGLSRIHIAQVETDKAILSDRSIRDICRIYKVNYEWLKNGDGEMHQPLSENEEIAAFLNDAMETVPDDIKRKLVLALAKLDDEDWKKVDALAKKLLNE